MAAPSPPRGAEGTTSPQERCRFTPFTPRRERGNSRAGRCKGSPSRAVRGCIKNIGGDSSLYIFCSVPPRRRSCRNGSVLALWRRLRWPELLRATGAERRLSTASALSAALLSSWHSRARLARGWRPLRGHPRVFPAQLFLQMLGVGGWGGSRFGQTPSRGAQRGGFTASRRRDPPRRSPSL